MSRTKNLTDEVLEIHYKMIVDALENAKTYEEEKTLYINEIAEATGLREGQIWKAANFGRRLLGKKKIKITQYLLAGNKGYFLPNNGRECVAYLIQHIKAIYSLTQALEPLYDYVMEKWPEEFKEAYEQKPAKDIIDDETIPWDVFNNVLNTVNIKNNELKED